MDEFEVVRRKTASQLKEGSAALIPAKTMQLVLELALKSKHDGSYQYLHHLVLLLLLLLLPTARQRRTRLQRQGLMQTG